MSFLKNQIQITKQIENKTKAFNMLNKLFDVSYEPFLVDGNGPVDVSKNQFKTIFLALTHASANSVVKVNSGVYQQLLQFKEPNLKVQANEPTSNVILIINEYPLITINLSSDTQKVFLQSLRMVHLCEHQLHFIKNHTLKEFREGLYRGFKVGMNMNTIVYVREGILQLDECKISLANNKRKQLTPCIIVQQNGTLIMNRCQVRGGIGTVGIVCKGGKLIIKQSKFRDHGGIGVYAVGKQNTKITIKNSTFDNCNEGIVLNGPFCGSVESNIITDCLDYGINILGGNESRVLSNEIKNCKKGIYIINSYSLILKNIISNNNECGIQLGSKGSKMCHSCLKFNQVLENKNIGVSIWGNNNKSQIWNNQIVLNGKVGIKISKKGNPHIFKNKINKTLGTGILICQSSTALVEKNDIMDSLNSNLVIQGPNNINNYIFENIVKGSRGQGILLSNGENFFIVNNQISKNNNGITSITSVTAIHDNIIASNDSNGILLLEDNLMNICNNKIRQNKAAGVMLRSKSKGNLKNNIFTKNKYELVIESSNQSTQNIEGQNLFQGKDVDIRIPSNYSCCLI